MKLNLLSNELLREDQRKLLSKDEILKKAYNKVTSITQNKNHASRTEDRHSKHTLFTSRISKTKKKLLETFKNKEKTHPYVDYFTKSSPTTGQDQTDISNLNSLINKLCSSSNFNKNFTSDKFHLLDHLIKISLEKLNAEKTLLLLNVLALSYLLTPSTSTSTDIATTALAQQNLEIYKKYFEDNIQPVLERSMNEINSGLPVTVRNSDYAQ